MSKRTRSDQSPIAFSSWTPQLFEDKFGFPLMTNLLSKLELSELNIEPTSVEELAKIIVKMIYNRGSVNDMNETCRVDLITAIVDQLIFPYNLKANQTIIKLEREYSVGKVELVLKHHRCIIVVIEAKRQDLDQGLLQNMMELHQAQIINKEITGQNTRVYGIISTVSLWRFTSYFPSSQTSLSDWSISEDYLLTPHPSEQNNYIAWIEKLTKICGIINWIITQGISF